MLSILFVQIMRYQIDSTLLIFCLLDKPLRIIRNAFIFLDDLFTDDEETHEFESLTPADSTDEVTSDENNVYARFPVIAPATPASPPTTRATSAHYPRKLRACEKKTDLYILQPERLNTSGQSNPLKGKLTNCHVTGCER